uniref:BTB domain-containing protein n=1 Tax=Branchiostoma floridae TaxID=7739 RepID=C3XXN9_BRAFL|eukprot:XP_002611489.1 hypothetical protein BRAFLDRAFT_63876 [Branchiostoma floridae]
MASAEDEPPHSAARRRSYQDESYRHGFFETVRNFQDTDVLQDVVIEVEDRRFPCHRLVLSAASPYFRAMFTSGMAESRQETVVLQGLDADMFREILSYIYSGTLHVSLDKVQPLYQAADLLQLHYVRDTCSNYMVMSLASSTCVDMYNFADAFSADFVLTRCRQWICRHFAKIWYQIGVSTDALYSAPPQFATHEEFCSLSVDQLTEIISHDELDVKEEMTVWEAVVRWVQHSREDRLHHLPSILPHIRFNLLTSDDTAAILNHPLVRRDPGRTNEHEILYMNPRAGEYISGKYDFESLPDAQAITVTSNNDIYVLAKEPWESHSCLFQYNHTDDAWERAIPSPVCSPDRKNFAEHKKYLVEVNGILYYLCVVSTRSNKSLRVTKYSWETDQWQECSQLELGEGEGEQVILPCGPHIYFLMNTEMHRYNPYKDRWFKRTPPQIVPRLCTAAALRTEIFCADLYFREAMVYHTDSDHWQILKGWMDAGSVETAHTPHLFVLENQLYLYLERYDTALETIEDSFLFVYDKSSEAWSSRGLKPTIFEVGSTHVDMLSGPLCPVARMYLPWLEKKGIDRRLKEADKEEEECVVHMV